MRINPVNTAYTTYQPSYTPAKTAGSGGQFDTVSLSAQGRRLQQESAAGGKTGVAGLIDSFMGGAGRDGMISLDEMEAFFQENAAETDALLKEMLQSLGISENTDITLEKDREGRIRVSSGLSEARNEQLEQALNGNKEFYQAFSAASATKGVIRAAEKHVLFAEAYQNDPEAAVQKYWSSMMESGDYILRFSNGSSDFEFKSLTAD
ncbi:MAG: hypothetical protein MI863_09350 [Desulfobacterales bacterium]|nr:hypothetical protein [Desulfobacterales bacterium]